jgi:hypothetical protein
VEAKDLSLSRRNQRQSQAQSLRKLGILGRLMR